VAQAPESLGFFGSATESIEELRSPVSASKEIAAPRVFGPSPAEDRGDQVEVGHAAQPAFATTLPSTSHHALHARVAIASWRDDDDAVEEVLRRPVAMIPLMSSERYVTVEIPLSAVIGIALVALIALVANAPHIASWLAALSA
jgi:hypothetical protein